MLLRIFSNSLIRAGITIAGIMLIPAGSVLGSESLVITNTMPNSYVWDKLAVGAPVYIDGFNLTFTDIPEPYVGLDYLRTSKSDSRSTSNPFISFAVNENVSVYVAMDSRNSIPSWLQDWSDTGDQMVVRYSRHRAKYEVYRKDFPVGNISLGGNEGGRRSNMYFVVVKGQTDGGTPVSDPVVSDPVVYELPVTEDQGTTMLTTQVPALADASDGGVSYELGMKFQSAVAGNITAVRHWKSPSETGSHVGRIWTATGTLLATVTFSNETASGWQQQALTTPLSIQPNTTYVVSVNVNNHFPDTYDELGTPIVNGNLSSVADGNNGVHGAASYLGTFPTNSYRNSNYYRDIVFTTGPTIPHPVVSDPVVSDPVVSDPVVSDPVVSDPVVSDPVVSDPVVSDPVVSDPVVSDPVVSDPVVSDPAPAPAPPPTVSLTSTASTVSIDDSTTLNWTASNADSCTASGDWFGSKETSGTESTIPLIQDATFILGCTGPGGSASQSITVKVQSPIGVATLNWIPPTTTKDGSALNDLAGYKLHYGTSPGSYSSTIVIANPGITTYVVENLLPATYYFVVTAFDSSGIDSSYSNEASKTINQ